MGELTDLELIATGFVAHGLVLPLDSDGAGPSVPYQILLDFPICDAIDEVK